MNDIHDMVGAYVLDALDGEEVQVFTTHLSECAACQAEFAELTRVVSVLPLALDRVEPPRDLKTRILRDIAETESNTPAQSTRKAVTPTRPRLTRGAPWQGFAASAAAVVLAAGGAWTLGRNVGNSPTLSGNVAFQQQVVRELAHGANVRYVKGANAPAGVQAAMVQPTQGNAYFIVDGMKTAPAGKVYELWLVRGNQSPRGAGVFTASSSGPQIVHLPTRANGWPRTAITVEPGPNGSTLPTTQPIVSGRLVA